MSQRMLFMILWVLLNKNVSSFVLSAHHRQMKTRCHRMISSGFSFDDGEQVLVSVQKPLGIILEQEENGPIIAASVDSTGNAGRAGVQDGDVLMAVNNFNVNIDENADLGLDEVLAFIGQLPGKVVNLRFLRLG